MAANEKRASVEGAAAAEYIASICSELAELAERSGFHTGSYLLKMASLEFTERQDCSGQDPKSAA